MELKDQLLKGQEENQSLSVKFLKERSEKETLRKELSQAHDEITSDQIEFQNHQKELDAALAQIASLRQEVQKDKKVKSFLEEQVSDYKTQLTGLKDAYRRIQTLQNEIEKTLSQAEEEKQPAHIPCCLLPLDLSNFTCDGNVRCLAYPITLDKKDQE